MVAALFQNLTPQLSTPLARAAALPPLLPRRSDDSRVLSCVFTEEGGKGQGENQLLIAATAGGGRGGEARVPARPRAYQTLRLAPPTSHNARRVSTEECVEGEIIVCGVLC